MGCATFYASLCRDQACPVGSPAVMNVNNDVEKLLNGEGLEVNDEFDSAPAEVQAVALRKTITYIVSAVIFNEKVVSNELCKDKGLIHQAKELS